MMLRAAIAIGTSVATGLLLGSGLAAVLGNQLNLVYTGDPVPHVGHHVQRVDPEAVLAGGLFEPPPPPPPHTPLRRDSAAASCDPPLALVGVAVFHSDHALSLAAIVTPGGHEVLTEGASVGGLTVMQIEPQRAVLTQRDGARCELRMFEDRVAPTAIAPPPAVEVPPERGVEAVGEHHFRIDRSLLDEAQTSPPRLRAIPTPDGVRVFGVRRGTPEHAAGLRNGDSIVAVDGRTAGPNVALEAYGRAMAGQPVQVTIERRGERITMTYELSGLD